MDLQVKDGTLQKTLKSQVAYILNEDERLYYRGRGANLGVWSSSKKGTDYHNTTIDFFKNMGKKGFGAVRITLFEEGKDGLEMHVEYHLPSYCEWHTFFEGFIENIDDLNRMFVMIGYNEKTKSR